MPYSGPLLYNCDATVQISEVFMNKLHITGLNNLWQNPTTICSTGRGKFVEMVHETMLLNVLKTHHVVISFLQDFHSRETKLTYF